ncbi:MAG TPA: PEP-CTERM sorting domain-containing protein [Telluria sp.]|nr:PEP-CTERM sorting domain-containing protein [Telluria sp.]
MKSLRSSMFGLVLAATAQFAAASPQLVINGNFETGDFTGWSQSGFTAEQSMSALNLGGTPGTGFAFSDGAYPTNGYLSQSITTNAGTMYTLQFDLKRWESDNRQPDEALNNYAEVMFGGVSIFSETNVTGDWIHYTFGAVAGTGGAETLRLASLNQFDYNQWDNVSLTANDVTVDPPVDNQVPEPASIAMFLLGLGVLGVTRRQQA